MEKITKIFNESQPGETSLIGSPREKWKHQIHKDMWKMGVKEENARDREREVGGGGLSVKMYKQLSAFHIENTYTVHQG